MLLLLAGCLLDRQQKRHDGSLADAALDRQRAAVVDLDDFLCEREPEAHAAGLAGAVEQHAVAKRLLSHAAPVVRDDDAHMRLAVWSRRDRQYRNPIEIRECLDRIDDD